MLSSLHNAAVEECRTCLMYAQLRFSNDHMRAAHDLSCLTELPSILANTHPAQPVAAEGRSTSKIRYFDDVPSWGYSQAFLVSLTATAHIIWHGRWPCAEGYHHAYRIMVRKL